MAEYLFSDDRDAESLSKRRKSFRGDFLSSWLGLQKTSNNNENDTDLEDDEENDKIVDKKLSFSERLFRKIGKVFKNLISIELVATIVPAYETADISNQEQITLDKLEMKDLSENDQAEYLDIPFNNQDKETDADQKDSKNGLEQMPNEAEDAFDLAQHIVSSDEILSSTNEVKIGAYKAEKNILDNNENYPEKTGFSPMTISAVSAGEILRQRQEKKRKKEVVKLKKYIQDLETEKKEVKLRQEVFSRELTKQNSSEKPTVPPRAKHDKINTPTEAKTEFTSYRPFAEQKKPQVDVNNTTLDKVSPLFTNKFRELIAEPTETHPNVILQAVEMAAEQNAPIESIYEHRHEVKDKKNDDYIVTRGGVSGTPVKQRTTNLPLPRREKKPISIQSNVAKQSLSKNVKPTTNSLYKQAVKGGFWTAIILITTIGLLIIISK